MALNNAHGYKHYLTLTCEYYPKTVLKNCPNALCQS